MTSATLNVNEEKASQVNKSKWDPPFLGYFELGESFTSVTLLNLPAFYLGASLRDGAPDKLGKLPHPGKPGVDVNGNGEYCDPGDDAPLPFLDPLHPFGFSYSFAPEDSNERIQDFDFDSGLGMVVVVTEYPGSSNRMRIVLAADGVDALNTSDVTFDLGLLPKRVLIRKKTFRE